nr:hypothetical protein [uncultured Rhodopila sp.]
MTSERPASDPTVEPSDGIGRAAPIARTAEKSDFLARGRYPLTDDEIHSRANVRHLMARSDALDDLQIRFHRLQTDYFEISRELSVVRTKSERNAVYDNFITFCNSAGFAVTGYAVSFLTVTGADRTLPAIWTAFGLLIAGGSLWAQIRGRQ